MCQDLVTLSIQIFHIKKPSNTDKLLDTKFDPHPQIKKKKSRLVHLSYALQSPWLILGCGGGVPTPPAPLPRGMPADAVPAANPVIPWIMNSGLQTISASPVHCGVLILNTQERAVEAVRRTVHHKARYCSTRDKSNRFTTGRL